MAWTLTPDTRLHRPGHWYQTLVWQWPGHWHKAAIGLETYQTLDWQWLEHWHQIQGCIGLGTDTRHLADNGLDTDTRLLLAWTLTRHLTDNGLNTDTSQQAAIGLDTYQTLDWQWPEHWHKTTGCYWPGHLPDTWLTMAWTLTPDTRLHRPGHWYKTLGWQWLGHWHKAAIGLDTYQTLDWQWLEHWHKIQGCYWSGHLQDTWLTMAWSLTPDTRLLLVGTLTRHLTDNGLNTNTRYKAA